MDKDRMRQKRRLQINGFYPRCPLCGAPPTDMHEIINRGRTRKGSQARALSMADELVVLICNPCNLRADNYPTRAKLLEYNVTRYGRMAVQEALERLRGVTVTDYIRLPYLVLEEKGVEIPGWYFSESVLFQHAAQYYGVPEDSWEEVENESVVWKSGDFEIKRRYFNG